MTKSMLEIVTPDTALRAACITARAATAVYNVEAEKDEPGYLSALFDCESLALTCIAATQARTTRGIAEKALLLEDFAETTGRPRLLSRSAKTSSRWSRRWSEAGNDGEAINAETVLLMDRARHHLP